ncbi:MAG: starch-binding protein [Bacteroidales bacterium]|nr:starch-binding protein [Bacteroidales bacterium]
MVTFSISQANATVVYYKNTNNWQTPTAHMWNGGEGTSFPGKAMTNLGNGWYSIDAGSNKQIIFNNGSDKEKTGDLQIPQNVSATAYVDGKWETVTYKLYHPWENIDEWYFKPLTDDGDGFYSLTGKWGDNGCDYECYVKENTVETQHIEKENITLENNPQKGDECTFTFNPADKSLTVTKGEPLPYKEVYIFGGVNVNEWDNTKNYVKMECNEGVYTYNFTYDGKSAVWAFYALRKKGTPTYLVKDAEVTPSTPQIFEEMDDRGGKVFRYSGLRAGRNYTIKLNCNDNVVSIVKNVTSVDSEIPVYPNGVSTESELKAYNFEANPVYYLVAQVLNDERPTPEWQMEKGADGKYHINGFAMRNTNCIGYDNTFVDGVAVRQYTSANSYIDLDEQTLNDLPKNPLSEGRLFNATFDPVTSKLTFEEDPSANHKMPFISLVGYMMQQDAEYATPRGVEGKPAGVTTATGWQEAWLQYDAEGNLLKDRKGNVMYSTMWPPKNPVYFTANAGGERHYSSDQMTFSPVKAAGKYVAKTGAEWEAELKASDNANADAYQGLHLAKDSTYYRYVVDDIWYVGAGKIWTGWAGQTVNQGGGEIAQWSNHRNWGYGNKRANDTDGTSIDPETTYGVSTEEGANGNFLFKQPTFFKTIEFFYDNNDPQKASKIYTTLAYGSASIAAQSNKEDGAYKKGSYQPSVSVPEGVTVTGYTIYRYDATTNQLAPIGDDGGKVAEGNKDPNSETFTFDNEGLADGRYYYVLKVDFSNGRSSKVRSNPFIIYYPGEYTLDANGYQLVKLDNAVNGYEYVTYNSKENGEMYLVNIVDDAVKAYEVLPTDKRDEVKALLSSNKDIKWTDKVFVYAPVPSSFKIDAEKNNSTINLEDITGYTLGTTTTTTVAPFNANAKELVKLDNMGNFAQRTYKAVMNYKEADPKDPAVKTDKSTLGKENITMMQMPNVKAKGSVVNVAKIPNSEVLDIIDDDVTKQKACNYYEVTLALNFDDPNVITAKAPRFKIGDKIYEGVNAGTHSITIACVNPLDFANATDITVDAVYYDGTDYTLPANIGEAAVLKADDAKFQVLAQPRITLVDPITSKMLGKNVVAVIGMSTTMTGADKIGETALEDEYYNVEFAIDDHATPDFSQILKKEDINFTGKLVFKEEGNYWIWDKFHWFENTTGKNNMKLRAEVTPMYVAHVTNQASIENLKIISRETPATAEGEGTYVALNGNPADRTIEGSITTGVTDINTLAPRARKVIENGEIHIICGDRKYNVMGAEIR